MANRRIMEYVQRFKDEGASAGFKRLGQDADKAAGGVNNLNDKLKKTSATSEETAQGLKAMLGPFGELLDNTKDATVAFGPFAGAGVAAFQGLAIEVTAVAGLFTAAVTGIYQLVEGADALLEKSAEFEARGLGIRDEEVEKIHRATAAMDDAWASMERVAIILATEVAPAVEATADTLAQGIRRVIEFREAIDPLIPYIRAMRDGMLSLLPGFTAVTTLMGLATGSTEEMRREQAEMQRSMQQLVIETTKQIEVHQELFDMYQQVGPTIPPQVEYARNLASAREAEAKATEDAAKAAEAYSKAHSKPIAPPQTQRFSSGVTGVEQDYSIQDSGSAASMAAYGRGQGFGTGGMDAAVADGIMAGVGGSADQMVSIIGNAIAPGVGTAVVALSNLADNIDGLEAGLHGIIDGLMRLDEVAYKIPDLIRGLIERLPEFIVTWIRDIQPAMRELALWITFQLPIEMLKIVPQVVVELAKAFIDGIKQLWQDIKDFFRDLLETPFRGEEGKFLGTSFKKGNVSVLGMDIPGLAEGGIVTRPTLAMVGEGRESEAVVPLSKLGKMMPGSMGGPSVNINGPVYGGPDGIRDLVELIRRAIAADGLGERGF